MLHACSLNACHIKILQPHIQFEPLLTLHSDHQAQMLERVASDAQMCSSSILQQSCRQQFCACPGLLDVPLPRNAAIQA